MADDNDARPTLDGVASVCHEANRAWCAANGDDSQRPWAEAEEWQRESARGGVLFALEHPGAPESAQHDVWCAAKIKAGWVRGAEKDAAARTHPCLVPFAELPDVQRKKDALFVAIVRALAPPTVGQAPSTAAAPSPQGDSHPKEK